MYKHLNIGFYIYFKIISCVIMMSEEYKEKMLKEGEEGVKL